MVLDRYRWLIAAAMALAGATAPAMAAVPAGITLRAEGYGSILADARGMTLYTFAKDPPGEKPVCEGPCVKNWSPLPAPNDATPFGEWSTVLRADGSAQWTFQGKPLYRYAHDMAPGDMNGDEQLKQWSVAYKPMATPPGFGILKGPRGHLLVDSKRMTLYFSDDDSPRHSACEGACARTWQPAEAWSLATATAADWTLIERRDGTHQWAYRGRPLYRYANDFNPGEVGGSGVQGWHPVVLQPPPPLPDWITLQESDGGLLYATAAGKTIYMWDLTRPRGFGIGFAREMESPEAWDPLLANASEKPVGRFSIVTNDAGQRQWTYKGMLLFTHKLDREAGDLHGIRNFDRVWTTIMASGQTMPGTGN